MTETVQQTVYQREAPEIEVLKLHGCKTLCVMCRSYSAKE